MRYFVCLLDTGGRPITETVRRQYDRLPRSRQLTCQWQSIDSASVLVAGDTIAEQSFVAHIDDFVAVGTARLDNRPDLQRLVGGGADLTDLQLVLRIIAEHGARYVPKILGDFAFVVWNCAKRTGVAAVDPFGVRRLYYAERNGMLAFGSRAEGVAIDDQYDVQYLAEQVALSYPSLTRTAFAGVNQLPGGEFAVIERGAVSTEQYWSPFGFDVESRWSKDRQGAATMCRDLLAESVRLRLGDDGRAWSQLSGGLDSSSVVGVAQWLYSRGAVPHGLAGTVTFVESYGTGADEREYSNAVLARWPLRNEQIIDAPVWHDDQYPPPYFDEPSPDLAVYPRLARLCDIVRGAGGRVLLSGVGGDELFTGNMLFFADWLSRGRIRSTVAEMARRAAIGRVSFWELAFRNAVLPLLPRGLMRRFAREERALPAWINRDLVDRFDLYERAPAPAMYGGQRGRKYQDAVATGVSGFRCSLLAMLLEDLLDVRHPMLYRPLVEFALTLPPELCAQPHQRKWVLREAMRGLIPESVRTRVGKGTLGGLFCWSTANQTAILEPLVENSRLADLGIIDGAKLRAGYLEAKHATLRNQVVSDAIQITLAAEAWLRIRSGTLNSRDNASTSARSPIHAESPLVEGMSNAL